ncbi:unnamed protein product [Cylindrotheca closterium]|uniref:MOSC domain-containing protein n=1 Tax=Cylindrotheca closterium TaxID=2856 RepID=A0AAD2CDK2_9STRA|nr:unnamed protein product [Cylindrotheca closterium]
MASTEDQDIIPTIIALAVIGITIHLTNAVGILTTLIAKLNLKRKAMQKASEDADASVTGVFIHPVKSLRAVSLPQAQLDYKGFHGDRRFMVCYPAPRWQGDTRHRFLTQRQCPSLATVVAKLDEDSLVLECGDQSIEIFTEVEAGSKRRTFDAGIWDDQVAVEDMGNEAAKFLQAIVDADEDCRSGDEGDSPASKSLFQKVRLVEHCVNDREAPAKFVPSSAKTWLGKRPQVSLTDGFPILIACEASLEELNKKLKEAGKDPISMSNFRPNIVIKGTNPFEEDKWKHISIGDKVFAIVRACSRCKQSCTNQQTGAVSTEPIEVMKSFRALGENETDVFFAQNAIPLGTGTIKVGDEVRIIDRGDPIYY